MRIACVLVTHLRAKVEMNRHPRLKDVPVVLVDRERSKVRPLVVDHFPSACGVRDGMTLEQAMSRHTDTVALGRRRAPLPGAVFGQMLTALQGISDRVEGDELGTAYVGHGRPGRAMFRGEAGGVSALLNAVPGIPDSPRRGGRREVCCVRGRPNVRKAHGAFQGSGRRKSNFLAPHAIDLLPVSTDLKSELHRFGLRTMGAVASMSGHALADRFGPEGRRAWELCNGIDDSPVVPLPFDESVIERTSLPVYSSSIEALLVAVDELLRRAYARPDMSGRYAGATDLLCSASGWPTWEKSVRFKQPVGAWDRASPIIRSRLEVDHPRSPVEDVTLTLSGITGESGTQLGLLRDVRDDGLQRLVEADRRLRPLMDGGHALYRIAQVAPWHPAPEMRSLQTPIDPSG